MADPAPPALDAVARVKRPHGGGLRLWAQQLKALVKKNAIMFRINYQLCVVRVLLCRSLPSFFFRGVERRRHVARCVCRS
jgi:hypothetical protein